VDLFRGAPSVGQFTVGNLQYLRLYSRSLLPNPPSEKELWRIHLDYGASLRDMVAYARNPRRYDKWVTNAISRLSPEQLIALLESAENADDNTHFLVTTGPSPNDRTEPERKIASQYILGKCCQQILGNRLADMKKLYQMLHGQPALSVSAGMLFEYRAHQFIREGGAVDLFPITGSLATTNFS
jgi:hypothetical protein